MTCPLKNRKPLPLPLPLLILLMLLPWGWISMGMWGVKSITVTVSSYMILGCLLPYLLFRNKKGEGVTVKNEPLLIMGGIIVGILSMFIGWYLLGGVLFKPELFVKTLTDIGFDEHSHFIFFAIYFVLINPVLEELFWRGVVYQRCSEIMPLKMAIILSSIMFGSYHWFILQTSFTPLGAIISTISVTIGGVIFTFFYRKTKGLLAPILVHGLGYDLPIIIIAYLQLHNTTGFSLF